MFMLCFVLVTNFKILARWMICYLSPLRKKHCIHGDLDTWCAGRKGGRLIKEEDWFIFKWIIIFFRGGVNFVAWYFGGFLKHKIYLLALCLLVLLGCPQLHKGINSTLVCFNFHNICRYLYRDIWIFFLLEQPVSCHTYVHRTELNL